MLKSGKLAEAWLVLERFSTRRPSSVTTCWLALLEAASLLDPQPGSELDRKAESIKDRLAKL